MRDESSTLMEYRRFPMFIENMWSWGSVMVLRSVQWTSAALGLWMEGRSAA